MGRSRGGLTSKVYAVVDANGQPARLDLSPGKTHDKKLCPVLFARLLPKIMMMALADLGNDVD